MNTTDIHEEQLVRFFIAAIVTFACLAGHQWHVGLGKGNATAAANSFQAREGATGVIGHNLVDSLIYKQSLMKFLVFINNALQPRAPVCRHRYPGIPRCLSLCLSLFTTPFIPFHFPAHTPMPPLPRVPSSNTLYRPGFQLTLTPRRHRGMYTRQTIARICFHTVTMTIQFSVDRLN